MALSSGNIGKCEFVTSEDFLPEKGQLGKAATIKRFEYLPLGSELKKHNHIAVKQYQRLNKVYEFDKNKDHKKINKNDKIPTITTYNRSDLICNSNHRFYKYWNIKKLDNLFFLNRSVLVKICDGLIFFHRLDPKNKCTKTRKIDEFNTAAELHN